MQFLCTRVLKHTLFLGMHCHFVRQARLWPHASSSCEKHTRANKHDITRKRFMLKAFSQATYGHVQSFIQQYNEPLKRNACAPQAAKPQLTYTQARWLQPVYAHTYCVTAAHAYTHDIRKPCMHIRTTTKPVQAYTYTHTHTKLQPVHAYTHGVRKPCKHTDDGKSAHVTARTCMQTSRSKARACIHARRQKRLRL